MIMFSGGDKGPRMFLRERLSVFADIWFNPRGERRGRQTTTIGQLPKRDTCARTSADERKRRDGFKCKVRDWSPLLFLLDPAQQES